MLLSLNKSILCPDWRMQQAIAHVSLFCHLALLGRKGAMVPGATKRLCVPSPRHVIPRKGRDALLFFSRSVTNGL